MRWWPKVTGCATCRCVKPGISVSAWVEARSSRTWRRPRRMAVSASISARSHRRMSGATWSLRERAVCSRLPASPASSVSRYSILEWTSSRSSDHSKRPARTSSRMRARTASMAATSAAARMRQVPSMRAWATDPWMSTSASRRSKETEALKRWARASIGSAKRPDHALPADAFGSALSSGCMEAAAMPNWGRGEYKSDGYGHPVAELLQPGGDAARAGSGERAPRGGRDPACRGPGRGLAGVHAVRGLGRAHPDRAPGGPVPRAPRPGCDRLLALDSRRRPLRAPGGVAGRKGVGGRIAAARLAPADELPGPLHHRLHHPLLRPAFAGAGAGDSGGAYPGPAGADPPALPLQQHQRRAGADALGAAPRGARPRGHGGPLSRAHGRQPHACAHRRGGRARAQVPGDRDAAPGRPAAHLVAHRGHAARCPGSPADAPAAGGERRLPWRRARHGRRRGRDRGGALGRAARDRADQPVPRRGRAPGRQQDGARQHPRATAAALRRRGEHEVGSGRRHLQGDHPHALSHGGGVMLGESRARRILIADDEAPARQRLRDLLDECRESFPLAIVDEARNGREALEVINREKVDIVLLDIRMPEIDGLEAARHIAGMPEPPAIIFTTAFDAYAIKAFQVNAIDYLLKPIRVERLLMALGKTRAAPPVSRQALDAASKLPRRHLSVHERGKIILVPIADVLYLRAELKYVTVRTVEREHLVEESLTHLEEEFADAFVRIHRNCLVARAPIAGFQRNAEESESGWAVLIKGTGEKLPVSRRQHSIVKQFR